MSRFDDHPEGMDVSHLLDEAAAEAILAGRTVVDPAIAPLAEFVTEMRSLAPPSAPTPSTSLAALLAGGVAEAGVERPAADHGPMPSTASQPDRPRRGSSKRLPSLVRTMAGAGLAARIVLGSGVAAAGMTGAAAAGILPPPVEDVVAGVVEVVTPFELPGHANGGRDPSRGTTPARHEAPGTGPGVPGDAGAGGEDSPDSSGPNPSAPPATTGPAASVPTPTTAPATGPATGPGAPTTTERPEAGTAPASGPSAERQAPDRSGESTPTTPPDTAEAEPVPAPAGTETGTTGTTGGAGMAPDGATGDSADGDPVVPAPSSSGTRP